MDTTALIIWLMGEVLIAIGLPLFYIARYLLAPGDKKRQKARDLKIIAVIWMSVGVLIYLVVLFKFIV